MVLNPEARYAAQDLSTRLAIPYIELTNLHRVEKIHNQYAALSRALNITLDDEPYRAVAEAAVKKFRRDYGSLDIAIGEWLNADAFEMALSLLEMGFKVSEIYGTLGEANYVYLKKLAAVAPDCKVFSNLSPTMLNYDPDRSTVQLTLGQDAMYYHPGKPGICWNGEIRQFGYQAVRDLFQQFTEVLK